MPEGLESLPTNEAPAEDLYEPAARPNGAGNETPDMSTDTDNLSELDMDAPFELPLAKNVDMPGPWRS